MFTPVHTLFGGYLLHLSTSSLLELTGRVFGVSGIVSGAILGDRARWRWSTLAGLALGPVMVWSTGLGRVLPDSGLGSWAQQSPLRLVAGGLLVGFGSRVSPPHTLAWSDWQAGAESSSARAVHPDTFSAEPPDSPPGHS